MRTQSIYGLLAAVALAIFITCAAPLRAENGPSFTILQPQANQSITGDVIPISVSFKTSVDAMVVRFEADIDGESMVFGRVRNPITEGSFRVDGNIANRSKPLTPGIHTLQVRLFDSRGYMEKREVKICVLNLNPSVKDVTAPTVRFLEPLDGQTIDPLRTKIRVDAKDDTGIKYVFIYVNGMMKGMMSEQPFSMPWWPKSEAGMYTLSARALDLFDNEGFSESISVTVPGLWTKIGDDYPNPVIQPSDRFITVLPPKLSGFASAERIPYANIIPPSTAGDRYAMSLPSFTPGIPRQEVIPVAKGAMIALLVPKLMPGVSSGAAIVSGPNGTVTAPAALAGPFSPARVSGDGLGLGQYRGSLFLPGDLAVAAGGDRMEFPVIAAGIIPSAKAMPSGSSNLAMPAVELHNVAIMPGPASINGGRISLDPATVSYVVAPSGSVRPQPVLIAMIPDKMMPAHSVSVDATPSVTPLGNQTAIDPLATGDAEPRLDTAIDTTKVAGSPVNSTDTPSPQVAGAELPRKSVPSLVVDSADPTLIASAKGVVTEPITEPVVADRPVASDVVDIEADTFYVVQPDETWQNIAKVYGTTPDDLMKRNPAITPDRPLAPGTKIVVPTVARLYVDNKPLTDGPDPYIDGGYTMVPIRKVVETKGGIVIWLPKTREVNAWSNNTFMSVRMNSKEAQINASTYQLPVAPCIKESRVMVPLRYLMTAMNMQMQYNPETGTYYLASKGLE